MAYEMLLSGKTIMPAGEMYRDDGPNQKGNITNSTIYLCHNHSLHHAQDSKRRPFGSNGQLDSYAKEPDQLSCFLSKSDGMVYIKTNIQRLIFRACLV
jgi:hypothetical protein